MGLLLVVYLCLHDGSCVIDDSVPRAQYHSLAECDSKGRYWASFSRNRRYACWSVSRDGTIQRYPALQQNLATQKRL